MMTKELTQEEKDFFMKVVEAGSGGFKICDFDDDDHTIMTITPEEETVMDQLWEKAFISYYATEEELKPGYIMVEVYGEEWLKNNG